MSIPILRYYHNKIKPIIDSKQNTLTGTKGKFVGFDSTGKAVEQSLPVDTTLKSSSSNPIANKAVYYALAEKTSKLGRKRNSRTVCRFYE